MQNKVVDSEYQFNSPFSVSKRVMQFLIDSLLLVLATILAFQLTEVCFGAWSTRLRGLNASMEQCSREIVGQYTQAQLMLYDEQTQTAAEDPVQGEAFLYSLVLSTLGDGVSDAAPYAGEHIYGDLAETERSVLYYYGTFKPAHREAFSGGDEAFGAEYIRTRFLTGCDNAANGYFAEEGFPLLDGDVAAALDRLICFGEERVQIDGTVYPAAEIYVELYETFHDILREARSELSTQYAPCVQLQADFSAAREQLIAFRIGELALAYALAVCICFLLVPLCCKGQTASVLFLRGRCIHASGIRLRWYNLVLRALAEYLICFGNVIFVILLNYGRYASYFLMCDLFGGVRFYMLFLAAVALLLASFVCLLFDRRGRRTLADRMSLTSVRERE